MSLSDTNLQNKTTDEIFSKIAFIFQEDFLENIIAACGNNCTICPRHLPKTEEELRKTAELWHKIGYRDKIVTTDEIKCTGCTPKNWCRYDIIQCVNDKNFANCGQCGSYPCSHIEDAFHKTMQFEPACRKLCSQEEYEIMKTAFFEKRKNLDYISDMQNKN